VAAVLSGTSDAKTSPRAGRRLGSPTVALLATCAVVLSVYAAAFARDWRLPGLYMDAINPEYLIPGILDPPPSFELILPGNKVFGDRYPVFTGTYYHGSVQLYAALPFMKAFGATLGTFRVIRLLVGAGILTLALWMAAARAWGPARVLAAGAAGLLALDPSFVLALRTQAYSCMFPLLLLFGCVLLLRSWRDSRQPWLRLAGSGILYGLAAFGYFIYWFFFPVLVWLLLRSPPGERQRPAWPVALSWFAGLAIGYLPFIAGMLLIRRELGGFSQLFDYLDQTRDTLAVTQDHAGLFGRVETVFTESRRVFTGEWPWLMILREPGTGLMDSLKADVLVLLPLLALAVPGLATPEQRRTVALPMALVLSFGAGAVVFGSRLDGHHYTAVLPLLYVAFGCACAAIWPRNQEAGGKRGDQRLDVARRVLVVGSVALVALTSLRAEQNFHRDLRATGGVHLYSDSIDRFAAQLDKYATPPSVYSPDWGFALPVAFLSDASPVSMTLNIEELRQEACVGKPQVVVFLGSQNEAKLRTVADLARRPIADVRTWSQRDGVPVFQTARFDSATDCKPITADASRTVGRRGRSVVALTPDAIPACPYITSVRAAVSWSAPRGGGPGNEIVFRPVGGEEALLARVGRRGAIETGPWAAAGMKFSLRNSRTHRELASATLASAPCPGGLPFGSTNTPRGSFP
jgi:hypothetical protein